METGKIHEIVERKFDTHTIRFIHGDNLEFMKQQKIKYYDLAIVDPPYGSENIKGGYTAGKGGGIAKHKNKDYHKALWEQPKPTRVYFDYLMEISKNQIVWGANHFISAMPYDSPAWVFWNKKNGASHFADGELAWTSFKTALRMFEFRWSGMLQENMKEKEERIHPTQKPVQLYKWLLDTFAKKGDKILDTHGGSGSIAIACHKLGFSLDIVEIEEKHFRDMINRFDSQPDYQRVEKDGVVKTIEQTSINWDEL